MTGSLWTVRDYLDSAGRDVIEDWYQAQPEDLQAKFDARMRHLIAQPIAAWRRPYSGLLAHECDGLCEVRFEYKNVQWRPLGAFTGRMEFTLLYVAIERGGRFEPESACEIALRRKAEVMADRRRTHVREFE